MPLFSWRAYLTMMFLILQPRLCLAFTGHQYVLDTEYSGLNFFDGWDFFSDRDPTGGFVTYYSRSSAQFSGLIEASTAGPAYMRINSVDVLPYDAMTGAGNGAGRPSVRIASQKSWTHGLFVGDFAHAPVGVCGTWPAFWTLGPNWPFTGEIDIMEGVNLNMENIMSLHTNETCVTSGNASTMTGILENTNCAYYPGYNVGCGVQDTSKQSFGSGFNAAGGGVFAMQWTSEYIRIWFWPRAEIPADITARVPDPGAWGLPTAELAVGNCTVDQHFQQHKIIFDTTLCGEYAGNPYVWNSTDLSSCAARTGIPTCDAYVATNPQAFADAYWEINSVRVYQLINPAEPSALPAPYIASEQPASTITTTISAPTPIATLNLDTLPSLSTADLCPQYNFSIISDGNFNYEIACGVNPPGPDITYLPYTGFQTNSLVDCIRGCSYYNLHKGTNTCGAVAHDALIDFCYFKKYIDAPLVFNPRYNEIRLIYYGYPQITDNPILAPQTSSSVFVETVPVPQTYRPLSSASSVATTTTSLITPPAISTSKTTAIGIPALGNSSTPLLSASSASDYSETAPLSLTTSILFTRSSPSNTGSTAWLITTSADSTGSMTTSIQNSTKTGTFSPSIGTTTPVPLVSTSPSVAEGVFDVTFTTIAARRLGKRSLQFLAFNGTDTNNDGVLQVGESAGYLTYDRTEATSFQLVDGDLVTTSGYFVEVINGSVPQFALSSVRPESPLSLEISSSGTASIPGIQGYCEESKGEVALILSVRSESYPGDCIAMTLGLAAVNDAVTATSVVTSSTPLDTLSTSTESGTTSILTLTESSALLKTMSSFTDATSTANATSPTSNNSSIPTLTGPSIPLSTVSRSTSPSSVTYYSTIMPSPDPISVDGFSYAGCFGIAGPIADVMQVGPSSSTNSNMTIKYCSLLCLAEVSMPYYMALHDFQCFCGTRAPVYDNLIPESDASCNVPCPGNADEACGGDIQPQSSPAKRQALLALISLYNNTNLLGKGSVTTSDKPITTSTITTHSTQNTTTSFPATLVSYNITGTNTFTVLSTTYIDTCTTCPDGLTTLATTITIPQRACTALPDSSAGNAPSFGTRSGPAIPMTTVTKSCACGENGSLVRTILTVPHTSAIVAIQDQGSDLITATMIPTPSPAESTTVSSPSNKSPSPVVSITATSSISGLIAPPPFSPTLVNTPPTTPSAALPAILSPSPSIFLQPPTPTSTPDNPTNNSDNTTLSLSFPLKTPGLIAGYSTSYGARIHASRRRAIIPSSLSVAMSVAIMFMF